MTCPTCKREDFPDTCGSRLGVECKCCGMTIIATADEQEQGDENTDHERQEQPDRNN